MPSAKVGDVNLYYEVHGSGEPLVLIMGFGFRAKHWFAIYEKLAEENTVILFDNRGTGQSDKPDIPYTSKMMAGDVLGLMDLLGLRTASIFGISMGGMIAQEFAITYPDRIDNLILGATSCGGQHALPTPPETVAFLFNPERAKLTEEQRARDTIPWLWNSDFVERNPEAVERFIATSVEYATPPYALNCQANLLMTFDSYDRLKDITAPTLVITGSSDRIIQPGNSQILASKIRGAELVIIEHSGHGFITDATQQASQAILNFLRTHRKST